MGIILLEDARSIDAIPNVLFKDLQSALLFSLMLLSKFLFQF